MQEHLTRNVMKLCAEVAISLLSLSAHMALNAYIVLLMLFLLLSFLLCAHVCPVHDMCSYILVASY